jgi:hypothetical protein
MKLGWLRLGDCSIQLLPAFVPSQAVPPQFIPGFSQLKVLRIAGCRKLAVDGVKFGEKCDGDNVLQLRNY